MEQEASLIFSILVANPIRENMGCIQIERETVAGIFSCVLRGLKIQKRKGSNNVRGGKIAPSSNYMKE